MSKIYVGVAAVNISCGHGVKFPIDPKRNKHYYETDDIKKENFDFTKKQLESEPVKAKLPRMREQLETFIYSREIKAK